MLLLVAGPACTSAAGARSRRRRRPRPPPTAGHRVAPSGRSSAPRLAGALRRARGRAAPRPGLARRTPARRPRTRSTASAVARSVRDALADPGVAEALTQQGFVVVPADFRLFHFAYQGNVYEGWPVFVTTDVAYHVWHQVFDKVLRSLEQEVLLPELETLVAGLLDAAHAQAAELAGTPLADAASRVEQLYQVAAAELGLPVTLGPLAEQEKALDRRAQRPERDLADRRREDRLLAVHAARALHAERGPHAVLPRDVGARPARLLPARHVRLPGAGAGPPGDPGLARARPGSGSGRAVAARSTSRRRSWSGLADDYTPFEVADAAGVGGAGGAGRPLGVRRRRGRERRRGRAGRSAARADQPRPRRRSA